MTYRAVFFDAGETLVHPHPSFAELFATVLEGHGHPVDPQAVREGLHVVADRFSGAARDGDLWTTSPERSRRFWMSVYRSLLEDLGVPAAELNARRLYEAFTDLANYRLFPDAEPVLRALSARGLVLGVVSNFEAWLERLLEALGVAGLFAARVISGIEGVEKPDPRIFRLALERTGVAAHEAVHVGDSPAFDTEPAEALGMLGVLIDRHDRFPGHPGPRVATLADLPAAIGLGAAGG